MYRHTLEVWIDGKLLSEDALQLYGNRLMRIDGGRFPDCQRLDLPMRQLGTDNTAEGTFGIVYWRGQPVPTGGKRAVALLACELWKACKGGDCKIPARVTTIEREGVSYKLIDPQDFLTRGRTGITEIDLWLSTINPRGLRSPAAVYSVDLPEVRSEWTTGQYPHSDGG